MPGKHIKNPYTQIKKKKKEKKQKIGMIDFFQIDDKPDHYSKKNIEEWTPKDFCFFFKDSLAKNFPELPVYRVVFGVDCPTISFIIEEFGDNNLEKKDVKDFIDQIITNDAKKIMEEKISNNGYAGFTTKDLLKFINSYLQKKYLTSINNIDKSNEYEDNEVEKNQGEHTPLIRELNINELIVKYKKGGTSFLLRNYGIPISATFLFLIIKNKNNKINDEKIKYLIKNKIKKTISQTDRSNIERIIKHSILRAPYSECFKMLDWRNYIDDIIEENNIKNFVWWSEGPDIKQNVKWLFIKQFKEVKNKKCQN